MTYTYTRDQLGQYLQRIRYCEDAGDNAAARLAHLEQSIHKDPLAALAELQRRHIATIPFGNSALHYSQHRSISLDPGVLFRKLVTSARDGYCMENSGLFYIVLRSLGFTVYATGGRVSRAIKNGVDDGGYGGLGHMVLIVTIGQVKYMVDVGFGPECPTRPLPLEEDKPVAYIAPAEMRLIKDSIPEFTDKSQKVWIYQTRHTPSSDWRPAYCFSEIEFLPQDFGVMNFYTSQSRTSWFTQKVVCVRIILDANEEKIEGQLILAGNQVKRRIRGESEVLQTLKTENDRVNALATWFGLHFQEEEVQGIQGLVSQISS